MERTVADSMTELEGRRRAVITRLAPSPDSQKISATTFGDMINCVIRGSGLDKRVRGGSIALRLISQLCLTKISYY